MEEIKVKLIVYELSGMVKVVVSNNGSKEVYIFPDKSSAFVFASEYIKTKLND